MQCLDKLNWWGKTIKVSLSKHTHIQLPKEGQSVSTLGQRWSSVTHFHISPLHVLYIHVSGLHISYCHIHSFIHSGHFYSAPSSPPLLRGAPNYRTDTVSEFHAEAHRQLQVKDLPKVPTWWLERESNPRPSG